MKETSVLADLLMEQLGLASKPDLVRVASAIGLRIKEVESVGFEGALIRGKDVRKGIICVKSSIPEYTRKRFTIAHEIGHYVIPSHQRRENVCAVEEVESWRSGLNPAELEANEFAAEFLLPTRLVRERLRVNTPSFQTIIDTADDFETSLTATTRRFIELTELACAMVWSQNGDARWFSRSDNFPFFLPLKELPHAESIAGQLFKRHSAPADLSPLPAGLWLDRKDAEELGHIYEQSLFMRHYDAVLSILWFPDVPKIEEEGPLEELDPADFTLGRRRWPR
jgi:hypothetical protein